MTGLSEEDPEVEQEPREIQEALEKENGAQRCW